jgi:hypothetical protein
VPPGPRRGALTLLGREDANWCTLATWASRTAGGFIREDEVTGLWRMRSHVSVTLSGVDDVLRGFDRERQEPHESLAARSRAIVEHVAEIILGHDLPARSAQPLCPPILEHPADFTGTAPTARGRRPPSTGSD